MRRGSVRVSNIQKWFFSEKAFRDQLRSWGWIYLFFCKFFFVDGIDFIRGYTALVSYL